MGQSSDKLRWLKENTLFAYRPNPNDPTIVPHQAHKSQPSLGDRTAWIQSNETLPQPLSAASLAVGRIAPPRIPPPQANSKAEAEGRRRRRSGGGGGHGVACEPLPGREGDPLPLLPILPRQRPREVPSAPPSPLSLSRVLDPI